VRLPSGKRKAYERKLLLVDDEVDFLDVLSEFLMDEVTR